MSKSAFEQGLRKSTNKQDFEYFLPAYLNPDHSIQHPEWMSTLLKSLETITIEVYEIPATFCLGQIQQIFPRLINTLVVEMMKDLDSDETTGYERFQKSASIAYS